MDKHYTKFQSSITFSFIRFAGLESREEGITWERQKHLHTEKKDKRSFEWLDARLCVSVGHSTQNTDTLSKKDSRWSSTPFVGSCLEGTRIQQTSTHTHVDSDFNDKVILLSSWRSNKNFVMTTCLPDLFLCHINFSLHFLLRFERWYFKMIMSGRCKPFPLQELRRMLLVLSQTLTS